MIDPNEPLPSGARITEQERAQRFAPRVVEPPANPSYAVRVLAPRTWEPLALPGSERAVSATQLTPLGGWQDPAFVTAPSMFHLQAIGLLRDITAEHFLLAHALEQSLKVLAVRPISAHLADALVAQTIKGEPFIARMAACFDADRAFLATGIAHRRDYPAYADTFGAMIGSIEILRPKPALHVEERVTRTLLDTVAFDAPISFRALEAPGGTETHRALDLFHKDPAGVFSGFLRIDLDLGARSNTFEQEMVYAAAQLMARGVTLANEAKEIPIEPGSGPIRARTLHRVPGTAEDGAPVEAWIALLEVNGAPLRIWMFGPTRQLGFLQWAANQRAFRVVLESLRPAM